MQTYRGSNYLRRIDPPKDSMLFDWFSDAYLVDSYTVGVPPDSYGSMSELVDIVTGTQPMADRTPALPRPARSPIRHQDGE